MTEEKSYLADNHPEVVEEINLRKEIEGEKKVALDSQLQTKNDSSNVVVADQNYPYIQYDGPMKHLPSQTRKLFGCHNCEWRGTKMCPFNIKRKASEGKTSHDNGICQMRINYLMNFYRGDNERPKYTEWVNDYNQGVAQLQLQDDWVKLKRVEERLAEFEGQEEELSQYPDKDKEDSPEGKKYKALVALQGKARAEWFMLWDRLMMADDRRITRETPKKVDVTHTTMSLRDIHKIMRSDVVDAEFEDVTEEDGNVQRNSDEK